jgi:hypothetical protein
MNIKVAIIDGLYLDRDVESSPVTLPRPNPVIDFVKLFERCFVLVLTM